MKTCFRCKISKKAECFYTDKSKKDRLQSKCKTCSINGPDYEKCYRERNKEKIKTYKKEYTKRKREQSRKHYRENITIHKDRQLKSKYGIGVAEYEQMLTNQNNLCAICKQPEIKPNSRLAVDHCHKTGAIRLLLCSKCNMAIGLLNEDETIILTAVDYIRRFKNV